MIPRSALYHSSNRLTPIMGKYVLKTDDQEHFRRNLWGTETADSAKEAEGIFRKIVTDWYCSSDPGVYLSRMVRDRERRLREDDFEVALL